MLNLILSHLKLTVIKLYTKFRPVKLKPLSEYERHWLYFTKMGYPTGFDMREAFPPMTLEEFRELNARDKATNGI